MKISNKFKEKIKKILAADLENERKKYGFCTHKFKQIPGTYSEACPKCGKIQTILM